ncbi:MAG: hypothetical protein IJ100_08220 [Lachnospiraceae bacterium]|nr:hypothetical protein [Lachnospiraceae bacterium]
MKTGTIVLLVILVILIGILVALYFMGRNLQKKQEAQEAQMQANKQPVVIMAVDKKRLKLKESGLPQEVIDQTPWYAKRSKVPVVKAKVGARFMNLIADEKVFDLIPINQQVKAMVSGIYIVEVKGMRGKKLTPDTTVKKSWWRKQMDKLQEKAGAKPVK